MNTSQEEEEQNSTGQNAVPQFIKEVEANYIVTLDVRSMLADGNDPLKLIQQTVKELQQGQVLKIINTFEPTPLITLLEKQGFECYADTVKKDLVETYFYKLLPMERCSWK